MFQAFSAWSESPSQKCLYVGVLIGPYLTAMVFNHPPTLGQGDFPPPPWDGLEDDPENGSPVRGPQRLCDLVIFMKHILEDPKDWKRGLSLSLRYLSHLTTTDIVENFEQGITREPSRIFSSEGIPQTPYDVTADENVRASFLANLQELNTTFCRTISTK